MNVLFLDIDGVLNTHDWLVITQKTWTAGDWTANYARMIDPYRLMLLRRILAKVPALVVISSSWRHSHTQQELEDLLGVPIFGRTPTYDKKPRGFEIAEWLRKNTGTGCEYVILDDDKDAGVGHDGHFVRTSMAGGLTESNVTEAVRILNGELLYG